MEIILYRQLMKVLKTIKEAVEFLKIVNNISFEIGEKKLIKIGDRYFKVKELG